MLTHNPSFIYLFINGSYYDFSFEEQRGNDLVVPENRFTETCEFIDSEGPQPTKGFNFHIVSEESQLSYYATFFGIDGLPSVGVKLVKFESFSESSTVTVTISSDPNRLTIAQSETNDDIFTWELACNFPYTLSDQYGLELVAEESSSGAVYRYTFVHPVLSHGAILAGGLRSFRCRWLKVYPRRQNVRLTIVMLTSFSNSRLQRSTEKKRKQPFWLLPLF